MRVLALLHHVFRVHGGIAKFNTDLLTALAAVETCEEIVVLPRIGPENIDDLPSSITLDRPASTGKLAYLLRCLCRLTTGGPFGLVVCGHIRLLPLAFLWRLRGGPAPVLVMHGIEAWQPPRNPVSRWLAGRCRAYIAVSALTRDRFCAWSGADPARFFILPNTVDAGKFRPGPRDQQLESRFELTGKRVIMTLGRLDASERLKGFDQTMEALAALGGDMPDLAYLIAGDGDDRPRLEARARALGIADRVVFTGFIDEALKPALYRTVDAFVMPSRGEGFGIVLLEALASGLPVVGSAADGSREALLEGTLGALVDPDDGAALCNAIREALARGKAPAPDALTRFSERAFGERVAAIVGALAVAGGKVAAPLAAADHRAPIPDNGRKTTMPSFYSRRRAAARLFGEYRAVFRILPPRAALRYVGCTLVEAPAILRSGHLYPADARMSRRLAVRYRGIDLIVDCAAIDEGTDGVPNFAAVREMYGRDVYLHLFDMSRIDGGVFVDVGGNIGLFTVMAAKRANRVLHIEAQEAFRPLLAHLAAINVPHAPIEAEYVMVTAPGEILPDGYLDQFADAARILRKPMAQILKAHGIERVSFLKCDIEGGEFPLFRDAGDWIGRIENIAMEVHPTFGDPTEIVRLLESEGFTVTTRSAALDQVAPGIADYLYASRTGALRVDG